MYCPRRKYKKKCSIVFGNSLLGLQLNMDTWIKIKAYSDLVYLYSNLKYLILFNICIFVWFLVWLFVFVCLYVSPVINLWLVQVVPCFGHLPQWPFVFEALEDVQFHSVWFGSFDHFCQDIRFISSQLPNLSPTLIYPYKKILTAKYVITFIIS